MSRGFPNLKMINAKTVRGWWDWLVEAQCGCCHVEYARDDRHAYSVCMGWHDCGLEGWKIAWKIGRQSHRNIMQCDLDVDFDMPYVEETGDVDDTLVVLGSPTEVKDNETISVLRSPRIKWGEVAKDMKREARRIAKDWLGKVGKQ